MAGGGVGERASLLAEVNTMAYISSTFEILQCNVSLQSLVHKGLSVEEGEVDGEGSLMVPIVTVSKETVPFPVAHRQCLGPQLVRRVPYLEVMERRKGQRER